VTVLGPQRQGSSSGRADDVVVAESWLLSDGRVRGLDLHWKRFARGCADARIRPSAPPATVESALPVSGRWFPRVEVRGDGEGRLLEGAYTSLLWWEGDVLWAVPDDAPILDGVTRRLLLDLAAAEGVEVRYRRPTAAVLDGHEVWLTSALHGIRAVTSSTAPGGLPAGPARRAPAWQARLEALAAPIAAADRRGGDAGR
jgi:hypothetical protein